MRRALALFALLLAGCGGSGGEQGTATLWITRDRGGTVLHEGTVPAGLTVMQALRREANVDTRYGGRFVQSIDGIEGSASRGEDWLYFVNGVLADRGAAEYRLREGEIVWWDYRRWQDEREVTIVVGAFPEPFLHGYDGTVRSTTVRYERPSQRRLAVALAGVVAAESVRPWRGGPVPTGSNLLRIVGTAAQRPALTAAAPGSHGPYRFTVSEAAARRLVREPHAFRFRYEVGP